jgi:hypothetical protein
MQAFSYIIDMYVAAIRIIERFVQFILLFFYKPTELYSWLMSLSRVLNFKNYFPLFASFYTDQTSIFLFRLKISF